jgi:O-antigen ligase
MTALPLHPGRAVRNAGDGDAPVADRLAVAAVALSCAAIATLALPSASSAAPIGFGGLAVAWLCLAVGRRSPTAPPPVAAAVALLLVVAVGLASAWAGRPEAGAAGMLQVGGMCAGLLVAAALCRNPPQADPRGPLRAAAAAAAAGAAVVLADNLSGGHLAHLIRPGAGADLFNRGISWLAILVFALGAGAGRAAVPAVAACAAAALTGQSATAAVAVAVGIATAAAARAWWRGLRAGMLAAVIGALAATPPLAILGPALTRDVPLPGSWYVRLRIWEEAVRHGLDHLPLGMGWRPPIGRLSLHRDGVLMNEQYTHAHNFAAQLFLELGVPGLVLSGAAFALAVAAVDRLPAGVRPWAAGCLAAALAVAAFGFNIWSDAMWAVWGVSAVLVALAAAGARSRDSAAQGASVAGSTSSRSS